MFRDKWFVMMGLQSWDIEIGSNCKNLAIELAKNNKVLYVNMPIFRKSLLKLRNDISENKRVSVLKGADPQIEQVSENLWSFYPKTIYESVNWIGLNTLFDILNERNAIRLCSEINNALKMLNIKEFILFNDSDMFRGVHLKSILNPNCYIYYIRDNLMAVPYFNKHGSRTEPITIKSADLVVTNSTYLSNYSVNYNSNSHYIGQGCDLDIYTPNGQEKPEDLKSIKGINIGYVGFLTATRLDIDLIKAIATAEPTWNIVLVGPTDDAFEKTTLHKLNNVYFLGPREVNSLPSYIQHFDICINPQALNELTIGNYPRKIDEYLSMGKPTVATKTPAMEAFNEFVYLASNPIEYVKLIHLALAEDTPIKQLNRRQFASKHTWENNVLNIYSAYELSLKSS